MASGDDDKAWLIQNAVFGETRRSMQLARYRAHYDCTQYAHLKSDWNGQNADQLETVSPELNVPPGFEEPGAPPMVRARRPTAPSNLSKAVTDRFTGLIFSDARRPEVLSEGDPQTTGFLLAAMLQARFWPTMREARATGGATGSVMMTVHVRRGKYCIEVHEPENCQIMWEDERARLPRAVLILYKYPVSEDVRDPKTGEVTGTQEVNYLYRRIITTDDDTVYEPVKIDGVTSVPWTPKASAVHGLGVFPGVWIQNLPVIGRVDGDPDCQGAWQMLDTYDRVIAQMNKAILLNLDPTPVIKTDEKLVAAGGAKLGSDGTLNVGIGGDAKYMEMTGGAITVGMAFCEKIEQSILKVVRCVFADPAALSGAAQSAKAIEYIYALMIEKADELRAQYGDLGVIPLLTLMELIARKTIGQVVDLGNGQLGRLEINLPPQPLPDGTIGVPELGPGGHIKIKWGPYFAPTEKDRSDAIKNINDAKAGFLLDLETAIRQAAPIFGLRDPEAIIKAVRAEAAELGSMGYNEDGSVTDRDLNGAETVQKQIAVGDQREKNGPAAGAGGKA